MLRSAAAILMAVYPVVATASTATYSLDEWHSYGLQSELPAFDNKLGLLEAVYLDVLVEHIAEYDYSGAAADTIYDVSAEIRSSWVEVGLMEIYSGGWIHDGGGMSGTSPSPYCSGSVSARAQFHVQETFTDPSYLEAFSNNSTEIYASFDSVTWCGGFTSCVGTRPTTENWFIGGHLTASVTYTYQPTAVPLPASLPLLAAGLGGLGFLQRRRRSPQ